MESFSIENTTTPGTATTVPSPSDTWTRGVPCHVQCFVHNTCISLLEDRETCACTPASLTPDRSVIVSSPSVEMWATVVTSFPYLPSRLSDRSNPPALHHGTPGRRSGVQNKHTDTVLGPPGQHSSRLGVLVMRLQTQDH